MRYFCLYGSINFIMFSLRFLILSLCVLSFGLSAAAQDNFDVQSDQVTVSYALGVDDRLVVTVFGEAELSGPYGVASDGTISMPLIGNVSVAGKTVPEAEVEITRLLADGYLLSPSVSVQVAEYRPFYILGEVKVPGRYSYVNQMSVLNAVAVAGGFTYRAKRGEARVLRGGHDTQEKDSYKDIDVQDIIFPGDVVVIDERWF